MGKTSDSPTIITQIYVKEIVKQNVLRFCITGNNLKEYGSKIAVRLPLKQRQQIDKLVEDGKFKNFSHVIRAALKEFLSKQEG